MAPSIWDTYSVISKQIFGFVPCVQWDTMWLMYVRMMLTVQPSCYVPKPMVFHLKIKLPMCKRNTSVILTVSVCISIIMIQPIVMKTALVLLKFMWKTVKQAILPSVLSTSFLTLKKACSYRIVSLKARARNVSRKINTAMRVKSAVQHTMRLSF